MIDYVNSDHCKFCEKWSDTATEFYDDCKQLRTCHKYHIFTNEDECCPHFVPCGYNKIELGD